MDAGRRQSDDHVSFCNGIHVQDFGFVHRANRESRQVIFVFRIEAGHFSGLAAHQGAARLYAAFRYAGNNLRYFFRIIFSHRHIVQKDQRLGPGTDNIIDAHGHTVNAYRVMLIQKKSQFQLGSHTVGTGNQHRFFHAGQIQFKQPAESADAGKAACGLSTGHMGFHQFHRLVSGSYIHACGLIAVAKALFHKINTLLLFAPQKKRRYYNPLQAKRQTSTNPPLQQAVSPSAQAAGAAFSHAFLIFCSNLDLSISFGVTAGYSPVKQPQQKSQRAPSAI